MKSLFFLVRLAGTLALPLCGVGCAPEEHNHDHEMARPEISLYDEHQGLKLPEEMQRELGVQLTTLADTNAIPESAIIRGAQEDFTYIKNDQYFVRTVLEELSPGSEIVTHGVKELWLIELLAIRGGEPCCR